MGVYSSEDDFEVTGWQMLSREVTGLSDEERVKSPSDIASDGKGRVYVPMLSLGMVKIYDFNEKKVENFQRQTMGRPLSIAIDGAGRFYIGDQKSSLIKVYSAERKPLFSFGKGELDRPVRIEVNDALGRIYVADPVLQQVVVYDMQGQQQFVIGGESYERSALDGEFNVPVGLAFDSNNNLYVADQLNARIQVFDADGNFLRKFGERGSMDWHFESPKDIAIDSDDNLWIADFRKAALLTYSTQGDLLMVTRGPGVTSHPIGFGSPNGVDIDANDRLFVSDLINARFSVWQYLTPAYLEQHPIPESWMNFGNAAGQK